MNREQQEQIEQTIKDLFLKDICRRDSNGSHIMKGDIVRIAEEYGINFKTKEAKETIVTKIIQAGFYERLLQDFKEFIYIPSWEVGKFYGFRGEQIDQLKQIGVITEDAKEESFYNRDYRRETNYNAYPLSVLNYDAEELKKAYDLAFNKARHKIRVETKSIEEVPRITEELKKVFIVVGDKPASYQHKDKTGYYNYYDVDLLNNSEYETNKLLNDIEVLKKKLDKQREEHRITIQEINNAWCEAVGVKEFIEAKSNKHMIDYYKKKIDTLEGQLKAYRTQGNIRGAGRKPKFTDAQKELILQDRAEGLTMKELAIKYNCGAGTIHKIIHEDK